MDETPATEHTPSPPPSSAGGRRGAGWKFALLVALLAAAVWYFRFTEAGRQITPESVLDWIESYPPVLARALYVLVYIAGTVLFIPGTALSFAGAVLFGAYQGTLYTWLGAVIGSTLAFLVSRSLGREYVESLFGGRFAAFDARLRENGFWGLLTLRLIPLFPFTAINFGSGLTGIRLRDYVLATAIGILPGTFVYQFLFAKLGRRALVEGLGWQDLADGEIWLALGLFAVFIVVGRWLSRRVAG